MLPTSGRNAPNCCECTSPLTGSDGAEPGFVHRWWKRTVLPMRFQSMTASVGFFGAQLQVLAHTSITPGTPSQLKLTVKQQVVPDGTDAGADTQIMPIQFAGSGFGAAVLSVLTSVAVNPGHSPAMLHVAPVPDVLLQPVSTNR